jgi:hypothetical protein
MNADWPAVRVINEIAGQNSVPQTEFESVTSALGKPRSIQLSYWGNVQNPVYRKTHKCWYTKNSARKILFSFPMEFASSLRVDVWIRNTGGLKPSPLKAASLVVLQRQHRIAKNVALLSGSAYGAVCGKVGHRRAVGTYGFFF